MTFIEEKNKQENKPVHLIQILDYNSLGTNLYYTDAEKNITYDSIEYIRYVISFSKIKKNSLGEIDSLEVRVGNVNRVLQAQAELYDLRGKTVNLIRTFRSLLDDPTQNIQETFWIDSYYSSDTEFILTLKSKMTLMDSVCPFRVQTRYYCPWAFKGAECQYAGDEETCNKSFQRCRELKNQSRYGGFPAIPSGLVYFA